LLSRLVYNSFTSLIAGLPVRLGYFIASALTDVHLALFPSRRHAALANLARMFPGSSRQERLRIVRGMTRSYNQMMFEFFRLPHLGREELLNSVEVIGRERIEEAVARGRGVILCTTHIGNWELAAVVLAHWGYTLHAVAGVQLNRWLTPAVRETKAELAIHTVSYEDGMRRLLRALERNEMVALMVDGDLYHHGANVEFFGRETRWPVGPGVLAQRTGALVICGYCERTGPGRFRIVIEPALDPATFPSAAALNAAIAVTAEGHIRGHLDQWCIFRPLWDAAPEPEGAPNAAADRVRA
jgi:KDO2-lipid IV(A) lauroyltransferase